METGDSEGWVVLRGSDTLEACFIGCSHHLQGTRTTGNNGIVSMKTRKRKAKGNFIDKKLFSLFPGASKEIIWFSN